MPSSPLLLRAAPLVFVLLWSSGWIVARAIAPYADPLTFLSWRFAIAASMLLIYAWVSGARWPTTGREYWHCLFSGILAVGFYFGGVWYAIAQGVPAGVSGLIATIQPLLTALLAPIFLNERVTPMQWLGILLSTIGIALVLQPKLAGLAPSDLANVSVALGFNAIGMVAFTIASIHQKKFLGHIDIRVLSTLQVLCGFIVTMPVAYLTEPMRLEWNAVTIAVMVWSVIVLSIGATVLYMSMIRAGAVSKVAALIYLVPLTVAVEAFLLFDERMIPAQIAGMLITAAGVALVVRK